jgi:hypothetical protein
MIKVDEDNDFQIAEYCGRLSCKRVVEQTPGRGRRRAYCSDTCRRAADREYKRAKSLVEHFEEALNKTRHEVAAYGRNGDDVDVLTYDQEVERWAAASKALTRVQAMLEFDTSMPERFREELTTLVAALAPLVSDTPAHAATA